MPSAAIQVLANKIRAKKNKEEGRYEKKNKPPIGKKGKMPFGKGKKAPFARKGGADFSDEDIRSHATKYRSMHQAMRSSPVDDDISGEEPFGGESKKSKNPFGKSKAKGKKSKSKGKNKFGSEGEEKGQNPFASEKSKKKKQKVRRLERPPMEEEEEEYLPEEEQQDPRAMRRRQMEEEYPEEEEEYPEDEEEMYRQQEEEEGYPPDEYEDEYSDEEYPEDEEGMEEEELPYEPVAQRVRRVNREQEMGHQEAMFGIPPEVHRYVAQRKQANQVSKELSAPRHLGNPSNKIRRSGDMAPTRPPKYPPRY